MIKRVQRTKILHANDFASNVLRKLEVYGHFAALGQRAVLAQKYHIEYFLDLVEGNLVLNLLTFQLNDGIYF